MPIYIDHLSYLQCLRANFPATNQRKELCSNNSVDVIDRVQLQEIEFASSNITDVNTFVQVNMLCV